MKSVVYFIAVLMLTTYVISNEIETEKTKVEFENKGMKIIYFF
jgi:hypothetical protein